MLERLETDYAGRFKLVKIDSDQEQQISTAFGIRSIPTCVLLMGGKPVDGFMGALPEGQIKAFLDKHLPSEDALQAADEAGDAKALLAAGDTQAALNKLAEALHTDPANDDVRFDLVRLLIECNLIAEAKETLAPALAAIPRQIRFEALQQYLAGKRYKKARLWYSRPFESYLNAELAPLAKSSWCRTRATASSCSAGSRAAPSTRSPSRSLRTW